jgi:hypothetical protein
VLQFGALDEQSSITGGMVDEVAEEMAEGLNGVETTQVNGAGHGQNGYTAYQPRSSGEPGDLLHRIEALEEVTARQDRVFQRIIKMLAAAVEKGI